MFRCNQTAAQSLANRLEKTASVLCGLLVTNFENLSESEYKPLLDDLCDLTITAKKYFDKYTKDGYLKTLLSGLEPVKSFERFDGALSLIVGKFLEKFDVNREEWNTLPPAQYDLVSLDHETLNNANHDLEALKVRKGIITPSNVLITPYHDMITHHHSVTIRIIGSLFILEISKCARCGCLRIERGGGQLCQAC